MSENMEKKQLLSELFALKAGLSQLSIEVDKLRTVDTDFQEKKQSLEWAQQDIEHKTRLYKEKKKTADKQRAELAKYKAGRAAVKTSGIVLLICAAVALIVGITAGQALIGVGVAILLAILGLNKIFPGQYRIPKGPDIRAMIEFDQFDRVYRNEIKKLEHEYPAVLASYNQSKASHEKVYSEVYPVADHLYRALVAQFDDTLRVRDWSNLDLVIHYLDSDRADTKREALLLADRQNQIGALIEAIHMACAEICQTIRTAADVICLRMDQHFADLSKQLAAQHRETTDMIGQRLSQISSAQSMQNALLAKISVDSRQLSEDVKYLTEQVRQ